MKGTGLTNTIARRWVHACLLVACAWGLLATASIARAQDGEEKDGEQGYVCYPDAQGEDWVCEPDQGQTPPSRAPVTRNAASDSAPVSAANAASRSLTPNANHPSQPAVTDANSTDEADGSGSEPVIELVDERPLVDSAPIPQATQVVQDETPTQRPVLAEDPSLSKAANTLAIVDAQVGTSPADWFEPTPPRPTDAEHALQPDIAASYFRSLEQGETCASEYIVREYPHARSVNNETFPIHVEADALQAQMDVSAQFMGNVSIQQGNRFISAPVADVTYDTRVARFEQGVRMDQPGIIMQGDAAEVHLNSNRADLEGVQFVFSEAGLRGHAQQMSQSDSGDLTLAGTGFTRCHPGDNGWRLNAKRLTIEEGEVFGTARGAVLRMKGVPVFYTPYLKFPVSDERVSGFLFPNLGYSDEDGTEISLPYYFNLAPNYDATVVPRYMSERGAGLELELRHLSGWQNSVLSGAMLPHDDIFDGVMDREDYDEAGGAPVLGSFDPADRWLAALDHEGKVGPFRTIIDYTSVSDADYFRDLGSDLGVSSRVELERRGEIRYQRRGFSARLWAQRFQRLDLIGVEEYQRLPQLDLSYKTRLFGPVQFNVDAQVADFERDTEGLNGLAAVTGQRNHIEPRVEIPFSSSWGFLNITGAFKHTTYDLDQDSSAAGFQLTEDDPERNIAMGSIDGGLFFERDLNWFNTALIQTLEPRVYYLYQEQEDQATLPVFDASELTFGYSQLFRENRFSGLDRIGDADQVSVGVTTRFLSRETGREYFTASIGEIYYFEDRRVRLGGRTTAEDAMRDTSAIASQFSARLFGNWRANGSLVFDPHEGHTERSGIALQYRRDNRHIFNVGFRRDRFSNVEQTDISLYWPLTKRLAIFGRWNQDLISNRTIEGLGGLEYSDCCLQVRLMARRFLDSRSANFATNFEELDGDDGIFLQIVFKGLAGFGNKVESVLERGIRGYRPPDGMSYFRN